MSWQVDYGKPNGKRIQRLLPTKALAKRDISEHLAQETFRKKDIEDTVRREAEINSAWRPDVARHSYASYHVAKYERKGKTAIMMENSVKMLDRHYRKPLHRSDTDDFWNIFPQ